MATISNFSRQIYETYFTCSYRKLLRMSTHILKKYFLASLVQKGAGDMDILFFVFAKVYFRFAFLRVKVHTDLQTDGS